MFYLDPLFKKIEADRVAARATFFLIPYGPVLFAARCGGGLDLPRGMRAIRDGQVPQSAKLGK
jgi:hypothetical protein